MLDVRPAPVRLLRLSLLLAVVLCIPFFIWGDAFTRWFTGDAAVEWLRGCGAWGWLAVLGLLIGDLFLPVPATGVMSAAGYLYGTLVGGALSALGSTLSGLLAYGLCRCFGGKVARHLAGADDLARNASLFQRSGPWIVALSRWMPLLPEVTSCLAGLAGMRLRTFTAALLCGSVPMGFAYAAIGSAGQERPGVAMALSIAVPAVLYAVVGGWLKRGGTR